jgi:hypothetical protein
VFLEHLDYQDYQHFLGFPAVPEDQLFLMDLLHLVVLEDQADQFLLEVLERR